MMALFDGESDTKMEKDSKDGSEAPSLSPGGWTGAAIC